MEHANINQKLMIKLIFAAVFMFGFAFALVPLYDVFCEVTGFNGKTGEQVIIEESDQAKLAVDQSREIKIQFLAMNNENAAISFRPKQTSVTVHPGEVKDVLYLATNLTDKEIITQAVPSVSPLEGAEYFNKIECFCFQKQTVAPGETKEMPLRFFVDKELPAEFGKLSLNYTIFDITEPKKADDLAKQDYSAYKASK